MPAKMYDVNALNQAGIPISKEVLKYANYINENGLTISKSMGCFELNYNEVFAIMQTQNRIETLERYMWTNVPPGLTQDLIERILFYRGTGVLYYNEKVDKFQFLPYALSDTIDEYGRYTECSTFPFTGTNDGGNNNKPDNAVYNHLKLVWDLPYNKDTIKNILKKETVGIILNDSSLAISQSPVIRSSYVKPILHLLSSLMQIIHTSMYAAADYNLIQVENQNQLDEINEAIDSINERIRAGKRFGGVIGMNPIIPLKTSNTFDIEGLFNVYNSITNLLKSITGIANPGVFDKKAHLLQEEQALNGSNADDVYYNGLRMRQEFCLMVQAYYGYPVWCESKRAMSEVQAENMSTGETSDPDNTQYNDFGGNKDNESKNKSI